MLGEISKHFKLMETHVRNHVNFQNQFDVKLNVLIVNKLILQILTVIERLRFSVPGP